MPNATFEDYLLDEAATERIDGTCKAPCVHSWCVFRRASAESLRHLATLIRAVQVARKKCPRGMRVPLRDIDVDDLQAAMDAEAALLAYIIPDQPNHA